MNFKDNIFIFKITLLSFKAKVSSFKNPSEMLIWCSRKFCITLKNGIFNI